MLVKVTIEEGFTKTERTKQRLKANNFPLLKRSESLSIKIVKAKNMKRVPDSFYPITSYRLS